MATDNQPTLGELLEEPDRVVVPADPLFFTRSTCGTSVAQRLIELVTRDRGIKSAALPGRS